MKKGIWIALFAMIAIVACQQNGGEKTQSKDQVVEEESSASGIDESTYYFVPVSPEEEGAYMASGKSIVDQGTRVLGGQLTKMISKYGPLGAADYCYSNALLLTDTLARLANTDVHRTSLMWRNPNNKPNPYEELILREYARRHEEGEALEPMVVKDSQGAVRYFSPIMIQPMCLNCHGTVGEEVISDMGIHLSNLYPNDKALGYEVGDFRGIWSLNYSL